MHHEEPMLNFSNLVKGYKRSALMVIACGSLSLGTAACGGQAGPSSSSGGPTAHDEAPSDGTAKADQPGAATRTASAAQTDSLDSYIGADNYLEIEDFNRALSGTGTFLSGADANLIAGSGHQGDCTAPYFFIPGDDSCSIHYPCPADSTYNKTSGECIDYSTNEPVTGITWWDWENLSGSLADHRVIDYGANDNAFVRNGSESCIATHSSPPKDDFNYVGVANNLDYAYFNAQRSSPNGNTDIFGLITQTDPTETLNGDSCHTGETYVTYTICNGDTLVHSFFQSGNSTSPLTVDIYSASGIPADGNGDHCVSGVLARDAIDYQNFGYWSGPSSDGVVALNTTPANPDSWGYENVSGGTSTSIPAYVFWEAAVPMAELPQSCAPVSMSWISVSSGSGGGSLKDIVGPVSVAFNPSATVDLDNSCDGGFSYDVSFSLGGSSTSGATCDLSAQCYTSGDVKTGDPIDLSPNGECSGTVDPSNKVPDDAAYCTVSGTAGSQSVCGATVEDTDVQILQPISATATLTPACDKTFKFDVSASGGSGSYTYSWSFSNSSGGSGKPTPTSSTDKSGTVSVDIADTNNVYKGTVTVTDGKDTTGTSCTGTATAYAIPLAPLALTAKADAPSDVCTSNDDTVTYTASLSGGTGYYQYDWSDLSSCTDSGTTTDTSDTCTYSPGDADYCATASVSVQASTVATGTTSIDQYLPSDLSTCGTPMASGDYDKKTTVSASFTTSTSP